MEIVRSAPRHHFTTVPNETARNRSLSWKARGLLVWLLSVPSGWVTDSTRLAEESDADGRDAVRTGLSELEREGYLVRKRSRDDAGRWQTKWYAHELPVPPEERTWEPLKKRDRTKKTAAETAGPSQDGLADAAEPTRLDRRGSSGAIKKTDTKTETKNNTSSSSSSAQARAQAPRPRRAQQQKVLMPEGWTPSDDTVRWCQEQRPDVDLQWTFAKYVAHRTENQQRSANWDEDFKAWVMREHGDDDGDVIDLRDRQSESTPKSGQGRAEWCGDCEEYDRTYEINGRVNKCPVCHPAMAGAF